MLKIIDEINITTTTTLVFTKGKSFDRINMTEKFVHYRKDHTDEHERWNLTEKVQQRRT